MNERDSEAVAAQLVAKGYSMANDPLKADVVLLNTCSVRDAAEQKAIGKMSHVASQLRSKNKNAVLGFMGCMAQSRGRVDRQVARRGSRCGHAEISPGRGSH